MLALALCPEASAKCEVTGPSAFSPWTLLSQAPKEDVSIHRRGEGVAAGNPDVRLSSWASGLNTGMFWGPGGIGHCQ